MIQGRTRPEKLVVQKLYLKFTKDESAPDIDCFESDFADIPFRQYNSKISRIRSHMRSSSEGSNEVANFGT